MIGDRGGSQGDGLNLSWVMPHRRVEPSLVLLRCWKAAAERLANPSPKAKRHACCVKAECPRETRPPSACDPLISIHPPIPLPKLTLRVDPPLAGRAKGWHDTLLALKDAVIPHAAVAELADAHGSGPCARKGVEVRLLSAVLGLLACSTWLRQDLATQALKAISAWLRQDFAALGRTSGLLDLACSTWLAPRSRYAGLGVFSSRG